MPRGFGVWLLFLAWVALSMLQLDEISRAYIFFYRFSLYGAATIFFLYVYNGLSRGLLSSTTVFRTLVGLWILIVAGGYLGVLFPDINWHTPMERVIPGALLSDPWFHDLVHARFSQVQEFVVGSTLTRPSVLFPYSNDWGAVFSLLAPLAIASAARTRTLVMPLIVGASMVPFLFSGNRAAWFSLALGMLYGVVRLARRGRITPLATVGLAVVLVAGAILFTPVGEFLSSRAEHPQSNETRFTVWEQSVEAMGESPIFGFGSPRPAARGNDLHVGTHGQLWMVLFSQGIPGLLLFVSFFVIAIRRASRARSRIGFWASVALIIPLIQIPFYTLLGVELMVVMTVAALAWHEGTAAREGLPARA
jgi:hypothetical protein